MQLNGIGKHSIRFLSDKASRFVPKGGVYPKGFMVGEFIVVLKRTVNHWIWQF